MDAFETINLNSKECRICKQETGEQLISCVLREKFSTGENISPTSRSNLTEPSFAHRVCLERWDTVMKNTYFPQPKKTWKDRIKDFISTGTSHSGMKTWTTVEPSDANDNRPSIFDSLGREKARSSGISGRSLFSESKEAYRVENVGRRESDHGQWRRNKVRICSVDSDGDEKPPFPSEANTTRYTKEKLQECNVIQLKELAEGLKIQINKVSSDLISHLQERDGLLLQEHTLKVTAGQLVNLQSSRKTSTVQSVPRSTLSTRSSPDSLPCK